ncbi:hypothetical protein [Streptomyces sp. NPDC047985]|uniref:hypothetical protein n=1 Tax=unclassified Streptomyces TaxID=2593676 RepID=UPI003443E212
MLILRPGWRVAREGADAVRVLAACLALGRDRREALAAVEGLAEVEESAVDRGDGGDVQGVALATPCGHTLVERGPLDGLQLGRAEEVRDLARYVESDRQLRDRGALVVGGVLGEKKEVGDGGADGAAADAVVAGEGGDGAAFQVRGAYGVGLVGRDGGAAPALVTLRLGGPQPVVRQLPL